MEQTSPTIERDQNWKTLEGQLRECYGRVVYSHKTHEKCADILLQYFARLKFWQIFLSVLTTGSLLTTLCGLGMTGTLIGALFSSALLLLNTWLKEYDFAELAQKHKQAATDIWLIREQYLSLLTDMNTNTKTFDAIMNKRDELLIRLHSVYSGSPSTNFAAYQKAQKALKVDEDMTFSDQEIDAFLPSELKRS